MARDTLSAPARTIILFHGILQAISSPVSSNVAYYVDEEGFALLCAGRDLAQPGERGVADHRRRVVRPVPMPAAIGHIIRAEVRHPDRVKLRRVVISPAVRHVRVDAGRRLRRIVVQILSKFPTAQYKLALMNVQPPKASVKISACLSKHSDSVAGIVQVQRERVRVDFALVNVHASASGGLEVVKVLAGDQLGAARAADRRVDCP